MSQPNKEAEIAEAFERWLREGNNKDDIDSFFDWLDSQEA